MVLKGDGLIGFFSYTWFLVYAIRVFLCFFSNVCQNANNTSDDNEKDAQFARHG
jgi:hypothetical protein